MMKGTVLTILLLFFIFDHYFCSGYTDTELIFNFFSISIEFTRKGYFLIFHEISTSI